MNNPVEEMLRRYIAQNNIWLIITSIIKTINRLTIRVLCHAFIPRPIPLSLHPSR